MSTKCYQFHQRLSLLAPPAEWQRSVSNVNFSLKSSIYQKLPNLAHFSYVGNFLKNCDIAFCLYFDMKLPKEGSDGLPIDGFIESL